MTRRPEHPYEMVEDGNVTQDARAIESNIGHGPSLSGRLLYWWSLFVAAMLLLILGPPVIAVSWAANRREWVYPWGLFGARTWLRLSGMRVRVSGREQLDARRTYVFISNHRSYLD